ncbi:MAG: alpha/beta hydrolase [Pirellulales bacterium]
MLSFAAPVAWSSLVRRGLLLGVLLSTMPLAARGVGPDPVPLWPQGAPGAVGEEPGDKPDIRVYLPPRENATGAAVVICPGGGYAVLAVDHEGHQVARFLNSIGVAGIVVKYRLAPRYRHPAPLQDAQRAIRVVRARATEYGVDPRRVGILGFSAGGHLASTAATHFDAGNPQSDDPVERQSCRPDFAVLCYPVISMTEPFGHAGSRRNLLGDNSPDSLAENLSNEKQVTAETPPTFIFHTGDDTGVPAENALAFYSALRRAKVPAELHIYQVGPHGVGLAQADPATSGWKDRLADWLRANNFLAGVPRAAAKGRVTVAGRPLRWGMIAFLPPKSQQPRAWAMVSNGQFSLAADRGPVVGQNRVVIYDLGAVEPRPTLDDAAAHELGVPYEVTDGMNNLEFELQ